MIKIKNIIFDFRAISMFILQVPPTSLIHKVATKDQCRANSLQNHFFVHINGRGKIHLNRDIEKPGSFDLFPMGTGCTPWFFRISAGTKLNFAFNNSSSNNNKKKIKKTSKVSTFQRLHLHERNFCNLDYKCS